MLQIPYFDETRRWLSASIGAYYIYEAIVGRKLK